MLLDHQMSIASVDKLEAPVFHSELSDLLYNTFGNVVEQLMKNEPSLEASAVHGKKDRRWCIYPSCVLADSCCIYLHKQQEWFDE